MKFIVKEYETQIDTFIVKNSDEALDYLNDFYLGPWVKSAGPELVLENGKTLIAVVDE